MKKLWVGGLLLCLLLSGCGADDFRTVLVTSTDKQIDSAAENATPEEEPEAWVEPLDGEALSPDGCFEVQLLGHNDSASSSGITPPERVVIRDTTSGEVLYEDMGYYTQSVRWSEDGKYLALNQSARTYEIITIIETTTWTSWQFTLPDGSGIPEYTFLPEDWGEWLDENTIQIITGLGGDGGEQHVYRCSVVMEKDSLTGIVLEETSELLENTYDFTHDGEPDTVELITILDYENGEAAPVWYEVRVKEDNERLWQQDAHYAHAGWTSIFALELDGQDYLLRYTPSMSTGCAYYAYQIFSLNEAGEEVLLKENGVEFDVNFRPTLRNNFDPEAIADFLEEVHSYLAESHLLLSTEGFELKMNVSGAEFQEDNKFWNEYVPYDESKTLEENLRAYEVFCRAAQGVE